MKLPVHLARWFVLEDFPIRAELAAVCDLVEKQREWFRQVPTVRLITCNYHELLASPEVDVVYVAVPHLSTRQFIWTC